MTKRRPKLIPATGSRKLNEHTEELPVTLNEKELLARGQELAKIHDQELLLDAESEAWKAQHKAKVNDLVERRSHLSQIVRDKKERRPTQVEGWAHYDEKIYREIRADTGEVVNERPLSVGEMQGDLPFDDDQEQL